MLRILLERGEWNYDEGNPLSLEGTFGRVFLGTGIDGTPVAVKQLKDASPGEGARELTIADGLLSGPQQPHLIPILDAGMDAGGAGAFVVMARAETSLDKYLSSKASRRLPEAEAVEVLKQIALGLKELGPLSHRDLKPANALFHGGVWKLADFGLARPINGATTNSTMRRYFTLRYAAPEQWRGDRPTPQTDVYALGCIGYELLTGSPPFVGDEDELSRKHRLEAPPALDSVSPRLARALAACLEKEPAARPPVDEVLRSLEQWNAQPPSAALKGVERVAAALAMARQAEAAEARKRKEASDRRVALRRTALAQLDQLMSEFFEAIRTAAGPDAQVVDRSTLRLGQALFSWSKENLVLPTEPLPRSGWDIACDGVIELSQGSPAYKRGANLWFVKRRPEDTFQWEEVAYMHHPLQAPRNVDEVFQPFALQGTDAVAHADGAAGIGMYRIALATPVRAITGSAASDFISRWAEWLAQAAEGELRRPSELPEH